MNHNLFFESDGLICGFSNLLTDCIFRLTPFCDIYNSGECHAVA